MDSLLQAARDVLPKLMMMAASFTGYPVPDRLPDVTVVPERQFVSLYCHGADCSMAGFSRRGEIVLRGGLPSDFFEFPAGEAFLTHELVHVLQYEFFDRDSFEPEEIPQIEREAYMAQNMYLMKMANMTRHRIRVNLAKEMRPYNMRVITGCYRPGADGRCHGEDGRPDLAHVRLERQ